MKAVLLSVKPKYCELIASGNKTVEIRKTRPKIDVPFKCYIYCTKGGKDLIKDDIGTTIDYIAQNGGKVIGEYICDEIFADRTFGHNYAFTAPACLDVAEVAAYCTKNVMYGWNISDLEIYDEPKELDEFYRRCEKSERECRSSSCPYYYVEYENCYRECTVEGLIKLTRPPQSWCYVEELEE